VLNQRASGTIPPKPKADPNYVIHHTPEPAPAAEKKSLLGSLKNIIKKDE
jgi:hypothetical protein